jgi:uncharacterized protein
MHTETPQVPADRKLVQSYHAGGFTISGVRHVGSALVFPDRVLSWPVQAMPELDLEGFEPLRASGPAPDILVVGSGARFALFPPALREALKGWGAVVEVMDTPAACRTYNLLLAEERRVAAALIALPVAEAT